MNSQKIIKTTAKGNNVEINLENNIKITVNGKKYKVDNVNKHTKIIYFKAGKQLGGIELTSDELEQIEKWEKVREEAQKAKDEKEEQEMKNNKPTIMKIKFGSYYMDKYVHFDKENEKIIGGYTIFSDEAKELKHAAHKASSEFLTEKLGLKLQEGIWQEIILNEDIKSLLMNELKRIEKVEAEEEKLEIEKEQIEEEQEENRKKSIINTAKKTGEKQVYNTQSLIGDDGNLIITTEYIDENGNITKDTFYDGD
jgi:hypothetical protein